MSAELEHANITVADPKASADMLCKLFGWTVRWEGTAMQTGYTVHVGSDRSYVALFSYGDTKPGEEESYRNAGRLNHLGVVVDDLDAAENRVRAAGYAPGKHADYEPGKRFYFTEENGLEIEVVSYA